MAETDETLAELVQRALREHFHAHKSELATAIGMTASPLGKIAEGKSRYFGPEMALRLATAINESPSYVLRVAGKHDLVELIEKLYGEPSVSPAARAIAEQFDELKDPDAREAVARLLMLLRTTERKLSLGSPVSNVVEIPPPETRARHPKGAKAPRRRRTAAERSKRNGAANSA